ncbi:MAG: leucine-rich repeat protein [Prevotella sp.]|nr:leucine-rich repeat protein [Prevotella sp.]
MSMACTMASAHDIAVANSDGKTIYYNYNSDGSSVSVTYQGTYYSSYSNEYTGTVVIPETVTYNGKTYSVTSIGDYAFYLCSGLTSVTIPNSVTSIGSWAFYYCNGLTKVIVPNFDIKNWCSIKFGNYYANPLLYAHHLYSDENTEITELVIPDGVTSIGSFTFPGCSGLTSVTIPNSVNSIGNSAFSGCSGLTSVTIPNSVTSIGAEAFYSCSGLTSVSIPNSVTRIGTSAFSGCSGLSSITIPTSVTSIGYSAFYGCSGLTSVTIPNSVTSIGYSAFYGCSGLTKVIVPNFDIKNWCSIKFCENYANPLYYAHHLYSDDNTEITKLVIPDDVTSIDSYAFGGCSGLTSVTIPNSVTSIGSSAFRGCSGLTSVTIPNSVTTINSRAFYDSKIKSLTIGGGIQTIASDAFSYSSSANGATPVKVVWLANTPPSGYENVEGTVNYVANNQYTKLSNATVYPFLNSMFEVGGIKYVSVSPSERTCDAIDCMYDASAENINIGKTVSFKGVALNVKNINPYACYMNNNIKSIDISNDGSIGQFAFSQAGMEKAIIKNNGGIGNSAFSSCPKLKTVELGQDITSIGSSAFQNCTKLGSIEIPDNVKTLGSNAFYGCTSLKSAKTGNGISLLNTQTFSDCTSLENVEIGTNITKISGKSRTYSDYGCFYNCRSLEQIQVPGNVKEIEDYVFNGCTGLKNVIIDNADTELELGSNGSSPIFSSCPLDSVYIGRDISYHTASSYGYSPFYRNTSLRTVHITDKETEISENEFYGCTNLKNVRIGDGVTYIGNWAFSGCSSIEYFSFGSAMQSIGKEAFSDCTAITKLISHAMTPPVCDSQALDDISKWECTLSVPKGTVSSYQQAAQWKEFLFIDSLAVMGDCNGDDAVTMADANAVVNYFLAKGTDGFVEGDFDTTAADVNEDGSVTMADANQIVNMFLSSGKE